MGEKNESIKLKILHCGEIHLDAPLSGLPVDKNEDRRRETRASFVRLMDFIRERDIDYVLISGDLFETRFATNTTAELLIREFRTCPNTKFIIAPGVHDCYKDNPIYVSGRLPSNCYIFSTDTLSRFDFEEDRVTVYGWAFCNDSITVSPLVDNHVDDGSKINLVCGCADLDGDVGSTGCPISTADITKFGADYYAIGSRHEKSEFLKKGGSMYGYCGALECTGFDDPSLGGVNLINIDYNGGEIKMNGKQIPFGRLHFVTESIDITGVDANSEIISRISNIISSKKYGMDTAMRVVLTGNIDPRFIVPKNLDSDAFGLYHFDMVDKTLPLYHTDHLKRDMSVAGEIYRRLLPMLESKNENDRLVAARAFRIGLAALESREIDI